MSDSVIHNDVALPLPDNTKLTEGLKGLLQRMLLASEVDVSRMDSFSENAVRRIENELAHYFSRFVVLTLTTLNSMHPSQGSESDTEIKSGDASAILEEGSALDQAIDDLRSKIESTVAQIIHGHPRIATWAWRHFLGNLFSETALRIRQHNDEGYIIPIEEFLSVSDRLWKATWDSSFRSATYHLASVGLNRLNQGGINSLSFLRERDERGDRLVISRSELRGIANALYKLAASAEASRVASLNVWLQDDTEPYLIELPKELFPDKDIEEIVSSLGRGGRRNVKVADWDESVRKALGREYVKLKKELAGIKDKSKSAYEDFGESNWIEPVLKKYPRLRNHPDLVDAVNPMVAPGRRDGYGTKEQWEVAIEIAAREVIPDYTKNDASADSLRRAAILPKEEE